MKIAVKSSGLTAAKETSTVDLKALPIPLTEEIRLSQVSNRDHKAVVWTCFKTKFTEIIDPLST